jgi:AAA domain, putative AbiEii toxin, Type IV TA system
MKVKSIRLQNFRSFVDSGEIALEQINVLIGENNSGKSSVLRGLHLLQQGIGDSFSDVRVGSENAQIEMQLVEASTCVPWCIAPGTGKVLCHFNISSSDRRNGKFEMEITPEGSVQRTGDFRLQNIEPHHFIVPFLSKRKTGGYGEDIREQNVISIFSEMTNLAAKLSRIANPHFPAYREYSEACEALLGFIVTAIPSINGQRPGVYLPDQSIVPIDQMGEGVPNIVALLCSLAVSRGKLFLVEEPENDLHPLALKALLDLIQKSSEYNQFVISTHSNIVVSHLCSNSNSQLLQVSSQKGVLPTLAKIVSVPPTPAGRIQVLHELGYSFSDFDLWDGWLMLEESSAERIVRDYLIPWFAPKLKRIKTIAAGGVTNVEPVFADFHRLMLFTHLQPAYSGRTWVRVDGDPAGRQVTAKLREKFPTIPKEAFACWESPQFEQYFPSNFAQATSTALAIQDKQGKRAAKRELLLQVVDWIEEDTERARESFQTSAQHVIEDLQSIEREFVAKQTISNAALTGQAC